jgi:hypothetical protein
MFPSELEGKFEAVFGGVGRVRGYTRSSSQRRWQKSFLPKAIGTRKVSGTMEDALVLMKSLGIQTVQNI